MQRFRTIHAVFKKELTQLMRYPTWIIQLLIWPLIFPLMYIMSALGMAGPDKSGFSVFEAATGTKNFIAYIVVGTTIWMSVNMIMWGYGTFLREEQMRGTLESNWLCPINKFDYLVGGGILQLLMSFVTAAIGIIEYKYLYGIEFTGNPIYWIMVYLIMIPGVYGVGMLFASVILWAKEANAAVNVVRGILMIVCGITFPVSVTPLWLQNIAKFIPFTYGIAMSRQIMVNGESFKSAGYNIFMCLLQGIILLILGRLAFLSTERKVKQSGSLERF